uniref:Cytochrome P450 n=1 Tax=Solanum lycopersicum TaxID=4081 RepID=A0A3Q7J9J8_SOLLC
MAFIWATLVVIFVVYTLLNNIQNRKRYPPGPKGLPIIGHLHLLGKNPHKDLQKLANTHGPFMYVRLGLVPTIIVSSAGAAEKVLKTYDHIFASRPHMEASYYLAYEQKNLISAKHGPYWRNMRKLCTQHLLSNQKINSFQSMRREQVELMIKSLKNDDRVVFDVSAKISSLSADLTCMMVFGKKYMDEDLDKRGFKAVVKEVEHLSATPNLGDFFPFLGVIDLQGLTRRLKDLAKVFDEFLEKMIDEHVQSRDQKQSKDFVDIMDPNIWPEPENFFPERFVGSSIDMRGRDFQLLPFGSGRRSCPAMPLGIIIVHLVVAQLVHCFDWELPNGMEPCDLDVEEHFGLATSRANPLMAIPTYRLNNA